MMYLDYFGLTQPPFKITPDPEMFFPGGNRGPVLQSLVYAICNGEGIIKVVGEVGSGKTMLCRMLAIQLPRHVEIAYLVNPRLPADDLVHAVASELKLEQRPSAGKLEVMQALQDFLLRKHAENRRVVLFVEEAQSMPLETLEELRLLSNLETHREKLLQIVLFGQPELEHKLSAQDIRQLRERITYSFTLAPLREQEVRDYLNSRLRASGYQAMDLFAPSAVRQTARLSRGLLRRINIIADKACLAAFAGNAKQITAKHVKLAARDSEFLARGNWRLVTGICTGIVAVLGIAAIVGSRGVHNPPQKQAADQVPRFVAPGVSGQRRLDSLSMKQAKPNYFEKSRLQRPPELSIPLFSGAILAVDTQPLAGAAPDRDKKEGK
ncbi:MAG: ExeA family protein [Gammaproteobacteria bacterium]